MRQRKQREYIYLYVYSKIWDLFLFEGEVALIKIALRVFQIIEQELIKKDYAESLYYLRSCTSEIDTSLLFKQIQSSKLTQEKLEKYYQKEKKKKREGIWDVFNQIFLFMDECNI